MSGCASGQSVIDTSTSLDDVRMLQATLKQSNSGPDIEQYQFARESFVSSMADIIVEQDRQAGAPAKKIKNSIAASGVVIGLDWVGRLQV